MLVIGEVAGSRTNDGWFSPSQLADTFKALRIPGPANPTQSLQQLRKRGLVIPGNRGSWSVTPFGRRLVTELVGSIDLAKISPELTWIPGADLGNGRHAIIPPQFAPLKWASGIEHLLTRSPFERNVFCMTRYPDKSVRETPDPVRSVIGTAREIVQLHGLVLHLASDRATDDELFGNVAAHMWACKFGIGLFEDRVERKLNYNLVIEVGSMLMTGRRCALLKDTTAPEMPTNFVGHIYKEVDFGKLPTVEAALHGWLRDDLALGGCSTCR